MPASKNVLVVSHGLDAVSRHTFEEVNKGRKFNVITAGPGEDEIGGMDAPPITSKFSLQAIRAYRRLLKETDARICFSPSTSGLSTLLFASLGLKGVKVIGYRGTQAKVHRTDPFNWMALLNPRVDHVVCETEDIRQYLAGRIGQRKVSMACKPYKLEWAREAMEKPVVVGDVAEGTLRLITIGYFKNRPHKGLCVLIDAVERLNARGVPVSLTVVGDSDQADIDRAPSNVRFEGHRSDAAHFLPSHDLYVLPSIRDASPRTLREAQACGVPCVVSDIPGARDLIAPGVTGVLAESGNAESFADAIASLAADRGRLAEMAGACRPFIEENFNPDAYVGYFENLFEKLSENS